MKVTVEQKQEPYRQHSKARFYVSKDSPRSLYLVNEYTDEVYRIYSPSDKAELGLLIYKPKDMAIEPLYGKIIVEQD